jgi:hypothetical protein
MCFVFHQHTSCFLLQGAENPRFDVSGIDTNDNIIIDIQIVSSKDPFPLVRKKIVSFIVGTLSFKLYCLRPTGTLGKIIG